MAQAYPPRFLISFTGQLAGPLIVAFWYLMGAELAFSVGTFSDQFFAPFWPPNVILFCALVFVPYSRWWLYIAVAFPVHVFAEWQVAMPPPQIIVAFVTNCAIAVLNALAVKYLLIDPPWFDSLHRALLYVLATCISPAVIAFGGAFVRIGTEGDFASYWTYWMQWYVANALGSVALGPILLVLLNGRMSLFRSVSWRQWIEPAFLALALVLTCGAAFKATATDSFAGFLPVLLYLPLPIVVWSAVRFGVKGASGAILIVTVVSIGVTLNDVTIFDRADAETKVLALQLFLTGFAIPVLLLGAAIEGMHEAELTARKLAQNLIRSHDEERRRTAKALHEGICQELAGASMSTSRMVAHLPAKLRPHVEELEKSLHKSIRDLRSASYLLHPPLLDESGLEPALCSFVEKFACETGIAIDLAVAPDLGRLAPDVEIAVFRFVQDALSDISRRPGRTMAGIRVSRCGQNVVVAIADGQPVWRRNLASFLQRLVPPTPDQRSIGLAQMRARLNRVGGELELEPADGTTALKAIIYAPRDVLRLRLDDLVADRIAHQAC